MAETTISLGDLIDYETQLARDAESSYVELEKRDRQVGSRIEGSSASARSHLKAWLDSVRTESSEIWPGSVWQNALALVTWVLILSGLVLGSAGMRALLSYDGSSPVNVIPILGIYVALQLLLIAFFLTKSALLKLLRPGIAPLSWAGLWLIRWLERRALHKLSPDSEALRQRFSITLHRIHRLHAKLFYLVTLQSSQLFALAFFTASLLTLLYLISIHDYAFAWSTTLDVQGKHFHRWISAIAWPFAWLDPGLVPSEAVIDGTHYSRLEARYLDSPLGQRSGNLGLTRAWWPFLSLCIVTYGLIPRLGLFLWAHCASARYLARWPFADQASAGLRKRLLDSTHAWKTSGSIADIPAETEAPPLRASSQLEASSQSSRCVLVRWFDPPHSFDSISALLQSGRSWTIDSKIDSRGTEKATREVLKALAQPLKRGEDRVVVTIHDPWELPGEAFASFIKSLRQIEGREIQVYCAPLREQGQTLAPADSESLKLWRQALGALHDPYVGLLFDQGDFR